MKLSQKITQYSSVLKSVILQRHAVRIVVLGHQKSGTTAIATLIAKMLGKSYANDPLYSCDWGKAEAVKSIIDNPSLLMSVVKKNRRLFCKFVLKDPDLSFMIPECKKVFDRSKFLFVVRDPRETIRSIADRLSLSKEELGLPERKVVLPNKHWQLILASKLPEEPGYTVGEVLAYRWRRSVRHYLENSEGIEFIKYEDFLADKMNSLRGCLDRLGLKQKYDITEWLDIQYQPKGNTYQSLEERLGMDCLKLVQEICSEELQLLGYR